MSPRYRDAAEFTGILALVLVLDRAQLRIGDLAAEDLGSQSLVVAAASRHALEFAAATGAFLALLVAFPSSRRGWGDLDHGQTLRTLAAACISLLAWRYALYPVNWFAGETHLVDRLLVVALATAALLRPAGLWPFTLVVTIMADQFLEPFGTAAARNIDGVLILALVALAAGHLLESLTGRPTGPLAITAILAALAAHFFVPGLAKLRIGWFTHDDLANLPIAAHTAGWLGAGGDGWSSGLSSALAAAGPLAVLPVGLVELSAPLAAALPRWARWWLPAAAVFHVAVFLTMGFWLFPWVVLELALWIVLRRPEIREWIVADATWARGVVAVVAVVALPGVLFHPPRLAWLDAPVAYGYRVEATDESGARYEVPLSAFAPLDQELAFLRPRFATSSPAVDAYGAVGTLGRLDALDAVTSFDDLAELEAAHAPPTRADLEMTETFFRRFLDTGGHPPWRLPAAPPRFWSSTAGDPALHHLGDQTLVTLEVIEHTTISLDDELLERDRIVFRIGSDVSDGDPD